MKSNKIPMRRCIGCMESRPKEELIRIAYYEDRLTVDFIGRAKGRGVYLCREDHGCRENALKKRALQRNFRANIPQEEVGRVFAELEKAHE